MEVSLAQSRFQCLSEREKEQIKQGLLPYTVMKNTSFPESDAYHFGFFPLKKLWEEIQIPSFLQSTYGKEEGKNE